MMIRLYRQILFSPVLLSFLLLLPCQSAHAGIPTDQLKQSIDAVLAVLKNKELRQPGKEVERRAEIRKIVSDRFDFREMARSALALNWRQRTPGEKKEFVSLFGDLIEDDYIRKVERYSGEKVEYVDEFVYDHNALVRTKVITKTNTEIPIDYMLLKKGAKWWVYDVKIEGVSLVNNYRTQFEDVIDSSSYKDLVSRLKEKVRRE
jgi:phospholipid transport system substrate-binding protein